MLAQVCADQIPRKSGVRALRRRKTPRRTFKTKNELRRLLRSVGRSRRTLRLKKRSGPRLRRTKKREGSRLRKRRQSVKGELHQNQRLPFPCRQRQVQLHQNQLRPTLRHGCVYRRPVGLFRRHSLWRQLSSKSRLLLRQRRASRSRALCRISQRRCSIKSTSGQR